MSNPYIPERAMAIYAHPDDIEFSCGGTLARWAKEGCKISYVNLTSGDVGIADPNISKTEAIAIRERESKAAADVLGAEETIFMREPDGMLEPTMALRKKIVREIRRFKPEVIFCGDPRIVFPSDSYINHPDHRAAATVTIDAIFPAAGQPNLFEEIEEEDGYKAHKPRKVYVSSWKEQDTLVDITDSIEIKLAALREHKSQMEGWNPEELVREWTKELAKGKEMEYAEGFKLITLVSDEDWEICKGDPLILDEAKKKRQAEFEKKKNGTKESAD